MYIMNDEQLRQLQKELDEKKHRQSEIAKQDLGGRMEYCKDCYFLKFDTEKQHLICNLDQNSKEINSVCAKNYVRGKYNEQRTESTTKPRTKNSGRSKKSC